MNAKTALELGAPIRGILAFTSTSTSVFSTHLAVGMLIFLLISDKAGRSIPAPGRGALTVAREVPSKHPLPILDVSYRSRQVTFRRSQISQWLLHEEAQLQEEIQYQKNQDETIDEEYIASRIADLEKEARRQEKEALAVYGMLEGFDPRIAPLRRALAVWGLTADDIGVLSIHGTSTVANVRGLPFFDGPLDRNFVRRKMRHLSGMISSLRSAERLEMLFLL
jgi:fatty acid synthase subunit alpha